MTTAPIPAFPVSSDNYANPDSTGMTLRDYFAAKAMQGFLSGHIAHYGHENHWPYGPLASEAYELADAMLKSREPA